MPPKVKLGDPGDLFFGLHDLAERIRSLGPDDQAEWPTILCHVNSYIEYLSSIASGREQTEKPLSGGMEQGVIVAVHLLETARRSAERRDADGTAEAVRQASRAIRGSGNIPLPSIAMGK
jgi:hypothetical protein